METGTILSSMILNELRDPQLYPPTLRPEVKKPGFKGSQMAQMVQDCAKREKELWENMLFSATFLEGSGKPQCWKKQKVSI